MALTYISYCKGRRKVKHYGGVKLIGGAPLIGIGLTNLLKNGGDQSPLSRYLPVALLLSPLFLCGITESTLGNIGLYLSHFFLFTFQQAVEKIKTNVRYSTFKIQDSIFNMTKSILSTFRGFKVLNSISKNVTSSENISISEKNLFTANLVHESLMI